MTADNVNIKKKINLGNWKQTLMQVHLPQTLGTISVKNYQST